MIEFETLAVRPRVSVTLAVNVTVPAVLRIPDERLALFEVAPLPVIITDETEAPDPAAYPLREAVVLETP